MPKHPVLSNNDLYPVVVKILQNEAELNQFVHKLRLSGLELTNGLDTDLLDVALDLLGIPTDDTLESDSDDAFCRDWFYDTWFDCKRNPKKFIALALQAKKKLGD